jgi:broad specificity phosphatase PhoE
VTTFLLVRHAAHDWLGRGIPGRLPGVGLNAQGHAQAGELAQRIAAEGGVLSTVYSSPQQRARETAAPLAAKLGLGVAVAPEFDEIDFGDWTGWTMQQLEADATHWRRWLEQRSVAKPPGGESFAQVALRTLAGVERLTRLHPEQTVLVVSHGDVIKAVLASFLGLSLDHLERFDIAPASLSVLVSAGAWSQVRLVNQALTGPLLPP